MKKLFSLMLILSAIAMCFSCSKDEEEPKNPLKYTLWSYREVYYWGEIIPMERIRYIEFGDNSKVTTWHTGGIVPDLLITGRYEINGNTVDFQNFNDIIPYVYYEDATFTSDSLKVRYFKDAGHTDGPYYWIFTKEE